MNYPGTTYSIFPLGDSAVTVDFGNIINAAVNREVIARFSQLLQQPLPGVIELVPAYSSLTIYYDVLLLKKAVPYGQNVFEWIREQLAKRLQEVIQYNKQDEKLIKIPVCYQEDFSPDLQPMAAAKKISAGEIINIHTSKKYKVYMLGFLPGFAYMGEVDEKITMPRKPQPQNVLAGSVGIAGKQTGIYPMASPGGWHIIGRTPLKLFDAFNEVPVLLKAGDIIQFYSISKDEFKNY